MVSSATCTAVRASISTPVGPTVSAVAWQWTHEAWASTVKSTATRVRAIGWHSGISSLVRLALLRRAGRDQRQRGWQHVDPPRRDRDPVRARLGADIDHVRLALGIEVGQ
jgi:hypothetical protein